MNLQEYHSKNKKLKILISSLLLACSQASLASNGIGLKLNTSTNQLHFSCPSLYNNANFISYRYIPDDKEFFNGKWQIIASESLSVPSPTNISTKNTKRELFPWAIYEFIGSIGGGVAGGYGGGRIGGLVSPIGSYPGSLVGLCIGSAATTSLIGAIGHQEGNVIGAFVGVTIGFFVGIYYATKNTCDFGAREYMFFFGCPSIGAVIGYNL